MANWWDSAPLAKQQDKWWESAPIASTVTTGQDMAASALSGLGRGIPETVEFLGAAAGTLPSAAISSARGQYQGLGSEFRGLMANAPLTPAINQLVGGEAYQPQTEAGRYARAIGAGASTGVIGRLPGVVSGMVGGAGAEGGGDIAAATAGEEYRPVGGLVGGLLGGAATYRYGAVPTARGIEKAAQEIQPMQGAPLEAAKQAAYKAVDESKSAVGRTAVKGFVEQTKQNLKRQGYVESAPEYASITRKLEELATKPQEELTPAGFDAWLKGVGDIAASDTNATRLGGILKRETNKFLENVQPNQMAYGRAEDAKLVRTARKLNAQFERDRAIEDAFTRVETRGPSVSEEVAIKNEFRRLSRDSDFTAGLPEDVRKAVEAAASTGNTERLLRKVGGLSPTGGRLGMAVNTALGGAAIGTANPAFVIPGALGFLADTGAGLLANRQANFAADAVRRMSTQRPSVLQRASGLARNVAGEVGGQVANDLGVLGLLKPNPRTPVRINVTPTRSR